MQLQESGEMYLETILILSKKNNMVRSVDIAENMNVSKPAVSKSMAKLKEDAYIIIDSNGYIALTEKGRTVAEKIYERHTIITQVLMNLGVDAKTAASDACKIEHDISDETFDIIKKHMAQHKNDLR